MAPLTRCLSKKFFDPMYWNIILRIVVVWHSIDMLLIWAKMSNFECLMAQYMLDTTIDRTYSIALYALTALIHLVSLISFLSTRTTFSPMKNAALSTYETPMVILMVGINMGMLLVTQLKLIPQNTPAQLTSRDMHILYIVFIILSFFCHWFSIIEFEPQTKQRGTETFLSHSDRLVCCIWHRGLSSCPHSNVLNG